MAPRDASATSKRKLTDRTKDKTSKKPKFEKRPPPPQQDESGGISDTSDFEHFSDDPEDGGAPLDDENLQGSDNNSNGFKSNANQAGNVFDKGNVLAGTHSRSAIADHARPKLARVAHQTEANRPR